MRQSIDKLKNKLYTIACILQPQNKFNEKFNCKMCLCADLVTTNNKCVLRFAKYMCFNGAPALFSVLLPSHVIKCVDYKVVVTIDDSNGLYVKTIRRSVHFDLMSITLQTGHFTNCLFQVGTKMLKFHRSTYSFYFVCFVAMFLYLQTYLYYVQFITL